MQRLYNSNDTITVKWKTCLPDDLKGEAKANRSYLQDDGTLEFEPGQHLHEIEIKLIRKPKDDDNLNLSQKANKSGQIINL